ncbi:MAG: hypothetical protein COB54_07670 [Alphaproteobacteria bacterium]|nr:MAG: hypothetical protein COB54_07670 [Alphaproteobacteria bacterium]
MPHKLRHNQKADVRRVRGLKSYLLASAVLALSVMPVQADVTILDVRTGLHPDKTRVVLEVNEVAFYDITYLDSPKEIIIDFRKTPSREAVKALTKKVAVIGLLDKITMEDNDGSARMRLKLRKAATVANNFSLNPDHGRQYRLVFDLKAVSSAEWSRQVTLTAPLTTAPVEPSPFPSLAPADMPEVIPVVLTTIGDETSSAPVVSQTPRRSQEVESYDEMVTGESNFTLSGYVEIEGRGFTQSSFNSQPKDWTVSFAVEPLLEYVSDTSSSQIIFRSFGRVDVNDSDRSHFDIRELKWTGTRDRWQMTVGIDTVFWGVTESSHLVDILNQDDNLEDIDQEDKLGQPMASLSYDSNYGVFSAYIMTYFRELRFPGQKGRFSPPLAVDYSQTEYQAGSGKWHTDWAVRWSHVIGNFDVGLYHFRGTNRDVDLVVGNDGAGNAVLIPHYNLIGQTGLDVQATFDDVLVKFEAIRRTGSGPVSGPEMDRDFWAMAGGIEYTFYGLGDGASDIGILAEYLYDDRGGQATTPFEDDLFMGMRWAANDIDSTEVLVGAIFDLDTSAKFVNVEGSRRIGDNWKVTLDARFFLGVPMTDPVYLQSRDDFVQIRLARYF